ncbi:hypothetical protein PanWU01x14_108210 [Parasponia andersonii]|uniref:Uncharacterized protein n=1 Tax=Parasponia andersonii TaxID=3476 RepID=A0A2P5D0G6_PARAD|nr:hypothetical protein PanWU01x14_108210 [Parasponia andersonii]
MGSSVKSLFISDYIAIRFLLLLLLLPSSSSTTEPPTERSLAPLFKSPTRYRIDWAYKILGLWPQYPHKPY